MSEDEIQRLFESGEIVTSTEEVLQEILNVLASSAVLNDNTRHREVIRAQTINYILMRRHIDSLNQQNTRTQYFVIGLAILSLITSGMQICTSLNQKPPIVIVQQLPPKQ